MRCPERRSETSKTLREKNFGEPGGARTRDHRIKSAMLYQLSYRPGSYLFSNLHSTRFGSRVWVDISVDDATPNSRFAERRC
jgi:hypothetical protein